jgi:hypothetical protein
LEFCDDAHQTRRCRAPHRHRMVQYRGAKKHRDTLPSNQKKVETLEFKVSGILPGTRSYECKVVGTEDTVRLSSKSLSHVHSSGSRTETPEQPQGTSDDSSGVDGVEESESSAEDAAEADVVDATPAGLSQVGVADWRPVPDFDYPVTQQHPSFEVINPGRIRSSVLKTLCDLFLAFFPMELVDPRLIFWREHATEHEHTGLNSLDESIFLRFLAVVLRMGLIGSRRRDLCFTDAMESAPVPDRFSEPAVHHSRRRICCIR